MHGLGNPEGTDKGAGMEPVDRRKEKDKFGFIPWYMKKLSQFEVRPWMKELVLEAIDHDGNWCSIVSIDIDEIRSNKKFRQPPILDLMFEARVCRVDGVPEHLFGFKSTKDADLTDSRSFNGIVDPKVIVMAEVHEAWEYFTVMALKYHMNGYPVFTGANVWNCAACFKFDDIKTMLDNYSFPFLMRISLNGHVDRPIEKRQR